MKLAEMIDTVISGYHDTDDICELCGFRTVLFTLAERRDYKTLIVNCVKCNRARYNGGEIENG